MAESIIIHFSEATWETLGIFLDQVACKVSDKHWNYTDCKQPLVFVYEYDSILNEYEDENLDQLFEYIDDFPKISICLQLRRSLGNQSIDGATELSKVLLQKFPGVVDDTYSEIWTLKDINNRVKKQNGAFLDVYRT